MKLPFSFGLKKKEEKNYYLALLLQDEKVGAVVLEESEGTIHVIGHAEERFPTSLEEASFEEWLEVIDKTISFAEESLPSKIQTERTVFGVKQDWLIEGKIKRGYLTRLKKICEELSLQPIGFLVFTEAILHLLQQEEGAPVSAILVELGKKFIIISVVRAGRIVETKLIPFGEPVTHSVDTALKEFSVEILPSRIILFNSEENKPLTQTFISHSWSKTLPFLHMPQITVLPATFDTKSVLYGTAAQLGFSVIGADSLPTKTRSLPQLPVTKPGKLAEETEETAEEPTQSEEAEQTGSPTQLPQTVSADYFGFVQGADVAKTAPLAKKPKQPENTDSEKDMDDISEEIEEIPEEEKAEETDEFHADNFTTSATILFTGIKGGFERILAQKSVKGITRQFSAAIRPLLTRLSKSIHAGNGPVSGRHNGQPSSPLPFPLYWLLIPAGIIVCILLIVGYIFGVSAKVTLTATPKVLSNQQPVTFVTDGTSNVDQGTLAGQTVSVDEKGSLSEQTTGVKQVGTPAKGQITIFSTLTSSTTIPKGTVVTSSNNLKYTLDSAISVASSSGNAGDFVTVPNVSITAADIGPEYNLPSGMQGWVISGYNKGDISGKNDAAFSGGTKKDVIVVSQADVDKLSADLIKSLEDKAKADLGQQVGANKTLVPFFTKEDLSQEAFNSKVGDQAQNLSLNATVTYESIVVDKTDMTSFASRVLQGNIPSDMTLTSDGIQTTLTDIQQSKNTVSGTLSMKASLLPKIDTAQLAKSLAGKSFQQAGDMVKTVPQIQSVNFELSPNLPLLPKILPRLSSHIHITLISQ